MGAYVSFGTLTGANQFLTIKSGASMPIKILRVDLVPTSLAATVQVVEYTGGGTITGGSTVTPSALREGLAAAGATSKAAATAISGTSHTFSSQSNVAVNSVFSYTPPASLILQAGSSTVIAVTATNIATTQIYFDELEILPGF